ncbi:MAG: beta-ketoacyl-[acyl-carrier-protein] synthase family protein [Planctomycetes bacterium]|nr:beta-ketoacyl-[acyl-carrier-protein] synthase family protein [Planctomycetota bacterium]
MTARRVVVTGVGAVSAAGIGAAALMEAICTASSCTRRISRFDPSGFDSQVGGEVADFSAGKFVPKSYRKAVKVMARDIELAVAVADLTVRDAALITKGVDEANVNVDGARFACNIGAGLICTDLNELGSALQFALNEAGEFDLKKWGREGMTNLTPLWLLKYLPNMLACHVTIIHDMRGPSNTVTCGEASGLLSIGEAWRHIARDAADLALAGGAESRLNPMGLLRQSKCRRLVTNANDRPASACRPFDVGHAGTVMGEGAGTLVLEDHQRACGRGARIYAEIVGFGAAADPTGMDSQAQHCGNVGLAAGKALAEAGIRPNELGLIIAHGTAVPHEDRMEAAAIANLLDGAAVPVISILGAVGNCHAGAGGLSATVAAMALAQQVVPASVNFSAPAAGCEMLDIAVAARPSQINYVLVQSFSHMGQSAAVVLKRYGAPA